MRGRFELDSEEQEAANTLMSEAWGQEDDPGESWSAFGRHVLWFVICASIVGGAFALMSVIPSQRITDSVEVAAIPVLLLGIGAVVWSLRSSDEPAPGVLMKVSVSRDGLELHGGWVASIITWSEIGELLDGPTVFVVRLRHTNHVYALPKRAFTDAELAELISALAARSSAREADGLEPDRYTLQLSDAQLRLLQWTLKLGPRATAFVLGLCTIVAASVVLAFHNQPAWLLATVVSFAYVAWYAIDLVIGWVRRDRELTFQCGAAGLRWVGKRFGVQLTWRVIDGWSEARPGMLVVRARDSYYPVLESAVGGRAWRDLREVLSARFAARSPEGK